MTNLHDFNRSRAARGTGRISFKIIAALIANHKRARLHLTPNIQSEVLHTPFYSTKGTSFSLIPQFHRRQWPLLDQKGGPKATISDHAWRNNHRLPTPTAISATSIHHSTLHSTTHIPHTTSTLTTSTTTNDHQRPPTTAKRHFGFSVYSLCRQQRPTTLYATQVADCNSRV